MSNTYQIITPTETGDHTLTLHLTDLDSSHAGRSYRIDHYDDEGGDTITVVRLSGNIGPEDFLDHLRTVEHTIGHEILGTCRIVELGKKIGVEALVESMIDELLKPMDDDPRK